MEVVELEGTRRQIGIQMGAAHRDEIRALYEARLQNAVRQALAYGDRHVDEPGLVALAERCLPYVREFDPRSWDELCGIAEGSRLDVRRIWLMNALTDVRDLAAYGESDWLRPVEEGCSAVLLGSERTGEGPRLAQTWDLATDNMPFVRLVVRRPNGEDATASMTLVGCLSLIGLNERGVAVGTTNVRATDNRLGVGYLDVIHRALHQPDAARAVEVVESAPRAGAHFYFVADPDAEPVGLECSAHLCERVRVADAYVHTNHMLHPRTGALEALGTPMASSHARWSRFHRLLNRFGDPSVDALRRILGDREGGENAIDRRDHAGISTNGAVIMEPRARRIHVVHGSPADGAWVTHELSGSRPR